MRLDCWQTGEEHFHAQRDAGRTESTSWLQVENTANYGSFLMEVQPGLLVRQADGPLSRISLTGSAKIHTMRNIWT